jgi:hypothetical protein
MTVCELITLLKLYPQSLEVQMSMNYEYQCVVEPHFLRMETAMPSGKTYVVIDNWTEKVKN